MKIIEFEVPWKSVFPGRSPDDEMVSHKTRYEFASRFVEGKRVLDVGCGSGYGAQMLLDAGAKKVVGIDIDKEALTFAKKYFNADFKYMNMEKLRFKDKSFDMAVGFASIGPSYWEKTMEEIKRVLKPGGIVIVSNSVFGNSFLESFRLKKILNAPQFTKKNLMEKFKENFTKTNFYGQGQYFFAFPGRGIVNNLLRVRRDHNIFPLEKANNPRVIICIGKVERRKIKKRKKKLK
jgi:SAM-dependent methyltransferase